MPWSKGDYKAPPVEQIKRSLNNYRNPAPNGTWIAMRYVVVSGKVPFHTERNTGHTDTKVPLSCGKARTAFDMAWVPADREALIEKIALKDGKTYRGKI